MNQDMHLETLFVFVTAKGRVMARLSNGITTDVTDYSELLPRHACRDGETEKAPITHPMRLAA